MELRTPLQASDLLAKAVGRRLVRVLRQVMPEDYEYFPAETRDQLSDGTLDLFFDDGLLVHLESWTEQWSVTVGGDQIHFPRYLPLDVTDQPFWRHISNQVLKSVHVLVSPYGTPQCRHEYGVLFTMANGATFLTEYVSDEEFCDTMRIMPDVAHIPPDQYSLTKI